LRIREVATGAPCFFFMAAPKQKQQTDGGFYVARFACGIVFYPCLLIGFSASVYWRQFANCAFRFRPQFQIANCCICWIRSNSDGSLLLLCTGISHWNAFRVKVREGSFVVYALEIQFSQLTVSLLVEYDFDGLID